MDIVIIGGNAAGMSFAAKYKRNNPNANLIVLEKRDYVSFGGCGLPYYVGGFFEDKNEMIVRTVEDTIKSGIDLRINSAVTDVDTSSKTVTYIANNQEMKISYNKLILSSGAKPIVPNFGDFDKTKAYTLTTMADGEKLKKVAEDSSIKKITIIGAGFIGLELLDAFNHLGKETTIIEKQSHIMYNQLDHEMAKHIPLDDYIIFNDTVESITDSKGGLQINTTNNTIETDIVIFAIGFRPNTEYINIDKYPNGAIITDKYSNTLVQDVFAIGDCTYTYNPVLNKMVYIPLATTANKQGKYLAEIMSGKKIHYNGMLGNSCIKILDYNVGSVGINEKNEEQYNGNVSSTSIVDKNHTSYYPNQEKLYVKIYFDTDTRVIIGGQLVGKNADVQKINVIAMAILLEAQVDTLGYSDFCYSPPFSRTWDSLNIVGNLS